MKKLLSSFGSGDDDDYGREDMEKMAKKIVELINTKESEDGSELVSLVKSFSEGYQTLFRRYDHLVSMVKKSAYSSCSSMSSDDDDDDKMSLDSNLSNLGVLESENKRLEEELELGRKSLSENSRLVMEIEDLKLKLEGQEFRIEKGEEEIVRLSLKNEEFKKEIEGKLSEIEYLRSELAEGDCRRSCLVEEICVLNSDIERLKSDVKEIAKRSKMEKEIMDKENEHMQINVETLEVKLRLVTQKLKITETQHKATEETRTQRMEELVQEKVALQQQILGLQGKANHIGVQTKAVLVIESSRLSDIVHGIESVFDRSYEQFNAQATKLSEELGGMKEAAKALREENGSLQLKLEGKVEEVEGLKMIAIEKDEEKREVIRQLCYQIEYHRDNCSDLIQILSARMKKI